MRYTHIFSFLALCTCEKHVIKRLECTTSKETYKKESRKETYKKESRKETKQIVHMTTRHEYTLAQET